MGQSQKPVSVLSDRGVVAPLGASVSPSVIRGKSPGFTEAVVEKG